MIVPGDETIVAVGHLLTYRSRMSIIMNQMIPEFGDSELVEVAA
jgi:hypothetical protein